MNAGERFRRVEALFHELVELPPEEREGRLEVLSDEEPQLYRFVAGMLDRNERLDGDTESDSPRADGLRLAVEAAPRLGPYELGRRIGQGGMGVVFEATQHEPLRRQVAIKLTPAGLDNERVLARFNAERQALAMMTHPGIAHVLDAGTAPDGRPYFAMELVRGEPITEYCDAHRMPLEQRLRLFVAVCEAVEHAHRKGIIHRDLKPSNILVTKPGDEPIPKVIDFGIAKAVGHRALQRDSLTLLGDVIGTPEHMSPEQTLGDGGDIDTRTDVYSLGVLLYELLCGERPLASELAGAPLDAALAIIRERESERPSRRLTVEDAKTTEISRRRACDAGTLRRRLRGDLDWIALKALAKDREQRYPSVAALAADARRYLDHLPVEAGPPSTLYRLRKLVRRHRVAVVAGLLVACALVVAVVGTSLGMVRARGAARLATTEAQTAEQITRFLIDLFEVSDPGEARGNTITAREVLDRAASRIEGSLEHDPAVRARLLTSIGNIYEKLGLYEPARELLQNAATLRRSSVDEPVELSETLHLLGRVERKLGDPAAAEASLREALTLRESGSGEDEKQLGDTLNELALLRRQGDPEEALLLYRRSLEINRRVYAGESTNIGVLMANIASLEARRGQFEAAIQAFEEALAVLERTVGPDHPLIGGVLGNLGYVYRRTGRYGEARRVQEQGAELALEVYGATHPTTGESLGNLARLLVLLGDYDAALARAEQALAAQEGALGRSHPQVITELRLIAEIASKQGRSGFARSTVEEALRRVDSAPEGDRVRLRMKLLVQLSEIERRRDPRRAAELARQALDLPDARRHPGEHGRALLALACATAAEGGGAFEPTLGAALRELRALPDARQAELAFAEAKARALAGEQDRALEGIRKAVELGFADAELLLGEDFSALRQRPDFAPIAERVQQRLDRSG